ncbi:MAG: CysS/YqeB C-terminal domain-containing protein [Acidimicrobiales bacterium]
MTPKLLVIMGSGETSPTMSKVHRDLMARVGSPPAPAALLDTPYGFQENADDISARALEYFARSVQRPVDVASFRSASPDDPVGVESAMARLRSASYVFSGPGSPSYALASWIGSQVPSILRSKLENGGCVAFASAAAVTLGPVALPVYEIYKVGEVPRWLAGLNLTGVAGLPGAVVVPHFNNAEGGNHDTRYCYMGERRLSLLESELPAGAFILGVDEHTACIVDVAAATVTVAGLGVLTIRRGRSVLTVAAGQTVPIARLLEPVGALGGAIPISTTTGPGRRELETETSPLLGGVEACAKAFEEALVAGEANAAVKALLELDDLLVEWSRDTTQSDQLDRARSLLRGMVVRLGEVAATGMADPRALAEPFVEALLAARRAARAASRWDEADLIRDRLLAAGVEVHDTPTGTAWELA